MAELDSIEGGGEVMQGDVCQSPPVTFPSLMGHSHVQVVSQD